MMQFALLLMKKWLFVMRLALPLVKKRFFMMQFALPLTAMSCDSALTAQFLLFVFS